MTGESIGDAYFQRLHELRNDSAQASRRSSTVDPAANDTMAQASNHGCESMNNDQSAGDVSSSAGCESITNQ